MTFEPAGAPSQIAGPVQDGSRLCLQCGLCCRGVLHEWARLADAEVPRAQALGLEVLKPDEKFAFRLPCPEHQDQQCSIYTHRFLVCHDYQCQLLINYLQGGIDFNQAAAIVHKVKTVSEAITAKLELPESAQSFWQQVRDRTASGENTPSGELAQKDPDLLLKMAVLSVIIRKYFLKPAPEQP